MVKTWLDFVFLYNVVNVCMCKFRIVEDFYGKFSRFIFVNCRFLYVSLLSTRVFYSTVTLH